MSKSRSWKCFGELESNGIRSTPSAWRTQPSTASGWRDLELEIFELAGRNSTSPRPSNLQEVLFVEQKLPVLKKTKTGPSTDAEVLEELARSHPLPAKIIEYRQYRQAEGHLRRCAAGDDPSRDRPRACLV